MLLHLGARTCTNSRQQMVTLRVAIVRWALDDQPGWVECLLTDVHGRHWFFLEKAPVVCSEDLRADTVYPRPGFFACQIIERRQDAAGKELLVVDTTVPWGIEATSGESRFEVHAEQVVVQLDA